MASAKYVNFNLNPSSSMTDDSLMSRMKTAGSSLNSTTWIIIGAVILFSILAAVYYFYYAVPNSKVKYQPNSEHIKDDQSNGKSAELLFFFADWCPHCKTAKPIWSDLQAQYENKTINGYKVIFTEVNCSEETAEVDKMMNQYNIEGYPTIKLLKDGQVIEYDAKPSKDTLNQFLNTVL